MCGSRIRTSRGLAESNISRHQCYFALHKTTWKKVSNFKFILIKLSMCCCHQCRRFDDSLLYCDSSNFYFYDICVCVFFFRILFVCLTAATTAAYRPWNALTSIHICVGTCTTVRIWTVFKRIQHFEIFSYLHKLSILNSLCWERKYQTGSIDVTMALFGGHKWRTAQHLAPIEVNNRHNTIEIRSLNWY